MKTIIGALVLVGVVVVYINRDVIFQDYSYEREASTVEVIEVEKEAWMTDEDAVKAAQDVIRRKQAEQELDTVQANIEALKASFKVEMELLKSQEDALTEELSFQ